MQILTQEQPSTLREPLSNHVTCSAGTFCIQKGFDARLNVVFYPNKESLAKMAFGVVATFPYGTAPDNAPNCLSGDFIDRHRTALDAAQRFIAESIAEEHFPTGFAAESGIPKAFEQIPFGEYVIDAPLRLYEGDGQYGRGEFLAAPGKYPVVAEYTGGVLKQLRVHLDHGRWTKLGVAGEHTLYIPAWAMGLHPQLNTFDSMGPLVSSSALAD